MGETPSTSRDKAGVAALPPLPPVEEVRPGLWSIPVPIPINPLRFVLAYALASPGGVYLIDTGWDTDEAFASLSAGLGVAGYEMADVRGLMVTHIHPDHFGLAGRIRAASGAWVGLHPADAALVSTRYVGPDELLGRVREMLLRSGVPEDELDLLQHASMPVRPFVDPVAPDRLIEQGQQVDVLAWEITALWTPGHSPGHLCFYLPEHKVLLSGDHVLPRITPNVSFHPQSGPDPLGDFLRSLDRVAELEVDLVLPAHEYRFVGLQDRVADLKRHHEARFAEILALVKDGTDNAWGIASRMSWSRPWERIDGFMRRAALGEALAHLHALRVRGALQELPSDVVRWRPSRRSAVPG
jgi:glyoxylase-like metal-dependent hydrolase (beta-lactamase superfamily II)